MKNNIDNLPEENEPMITFKKVMRGFDPDEVTEYIDEMNSTMHNNSKNYESRMAEMNQELTLVSRERNSLTQKCTDLETKLRQTIALLKEKTEEAESPDTSKDALIASLQKSLDEEREANEGMKKELEAAKEEAKALGEQISIIEEELRDCSEKLKSYENIANRQSSLHERYEEALASLETVKSASSALSDEKERLEADVRDKAEHMAKTDEENTELRTELNRIKIENSLLSEKNEQYKAEISALKSDAKSKEYGFAEKLSAQRAELEKEKITFGKKLQLQLFHIEQADSAIEELKKQLEQIKQSFSE